MSILGNEEALNPEVRITLDLKQMLQSTLEGLRADINYAYPAGTLDEDRAHAALLQADARAKTLLDLIKALK